MWYPRGAFNCRDSDRQLLILNRKGGFLIAFTAKFKVARKVPSGVQLDKDGKMVDPDAKPWAHEVEFTPDYAGGKNAEWAAATPAGMIRLTIKNELAAAQCDPGDSYTITFQKDEK